MARTAFSVRFPAPLADALDDWASARHSSRSDLVEAIITATTAEDRDEILQAPVSGAPTEKLNLRLSPAALAHLAQLAGDFPPADFLRRTVTAVLGLADQPQAEPRGSSAASVPRAGRRSLTRADSETEVHAPLIGLVVLVVIAALGIVVWLLVQALARVSEPLPPAPSPDSGVNSTPERRTEPAHDGHGEGARKGRETASCFPRFLSVRIVSCTNSKEFDPEDEYGPGEVTMVTQREVLAFIAERTTDGRAVGVGQVGDHFVLSSEAAAGHLWRLWRERLVEPLSPRPVRFRFRLEPGESISPLLFRITRRGRERLRWHDKAADRGGWLLFQ